MSVKKYAHSINFVCLNEPTNQFQRNNIIMGVILLFNGGGNERKFKIRDDEIE